MNEIVNIQPFNKELPSDFADRLGVYYTSQVTIQHKKGNGQFFAPRPIARLMASYCELSKPSVRVLDPGCGTAILSCALIERIIDAQEDIEQIDLVGYETDYSLISYSRKALDYLRDWLLIKDIKLDYVVHPHDVVLHHSKVLLYLGDTARKDLFVDEKGLNDLGIPINQHSKLPDVVIYDHKKRWLFLIEAVTSHGPVSPKRLLELEKFLENCKVGKIYVTAFPDMSEFKKHSSKVAWETEVWVMEVPDHMIHFNGDRFMGPR